MPNEIEAILYAVLGVIALVSLFFAISQNRKWEQENPSRLGFRWGYFFIFSTIAGHGLVAIYFVLGAFEDGDFRRILIGLVALTFLIFVGSQAHGRRRWALFLVTVLSLNLLWMFINLVYLRNRWSEFREESNFRNPKTPKQTEVGEDTETEAAQRLPQAWRLVFFAGVSWVLAVGVFVVLFSPYGSYMRDDDMMHMIYVMFLPSGVGMGLYWAYERFVR